MCFRACFRLRRVWSKKCAKRGEIRFQVGVSVRKVVERMAGSVELCVRAARGSAHVYTTVVRTVCWPEYAAAVGGCC